MTTENQHLRRAVEIAQRMSAELRGNPAVALVDVGRADESGEPVVRVHVRLGVDAPEVPKAVNGVAVVVLTSDVRLEQDE